MRAGRNLGALVAALLVGVTVGQAGFSPNANDYTVESAESGPLSQEVAFRGIATPWEDLPVANMVVGVLSSAGNAVERQAVRTSWAQLQSLTDPKLNRLVSIYFTFIHSPSSCPYVSLPLACHRRANASSSVAPNKSIAAYLFLTIVLFFCRFFLFYFWWGVGWVRCRLARDQHTDLGAKAGARRAICRWGHVGP